MIKNDEFSLIVNTTEGKQAVRESNSIRREAVARKVTYYTTLAGALATCEAIDHLQDVAVNRLQDLHKEVLDMTRKPMTSKGAERLRVSSSDSSRWSARASSRPSPRRVRTAI